MASGVFTGVFTIFDPFNLSEYFRKVANHSEDEDGLLKKSDNIGSKCLAYASFLIALSTLCSKKYVWRKENNPYNLSKLEQGGFSKIDISALASYSTMSKEEITEALMFFVSLGFVEIVEEKGSRDLLIRVNSTHIHTAIDYEADEKKTQFNRMVQGVPLVFESPADKDEKIKNLTNEVKELKAANERLTASLKVKDSDATIDRLGLFR